MPKQDSKIQQVPTCLLRVNIHCEGCKHKVKKTLKKVEGVYKVNIDAEQGKVSVSGNVDPATLINKLEKSGKHAEMWGPPQKGPISFNHLNNNNNFHIGKNDKGFKEQKNKGGGGVHQLPQHLNNKNGSKDVKIVGKNQNSVRFKLPEEEYDDDDEDDYSDDFDDDEEDGDFDDGSDDGGGYAHHHPPGGGKGAHLAGHHAPKSNKPTPPKVKKGKNGDKDKNGGDVKKSGGGINMFIKGMLGKASGKNGKVGDGHHKEGNEKKKDKKDGFVHEHGKINGGKSKENWSKKAGEKFDNGGHKEKSNNKKQGFNEMNLNHRGGGGGGGGGMGDFHGLPKTMNGGHLQGGVGGGGGGGGQGNPYNQQQMAMMMMMMNQQNANRPEAYHPLGYAAARPQPPAGMSYGQPPPHAMGYYGQQQPQHAMNYGQPQHAMNYGQPPPMANDQYSHIFSDENTDSCSIM
ncbi:hypothetical protein ABFS83_02G098800 [Erythranthe nasuta]